MFGIQAGAGKKPTRPRVEKRHGSGNRLGSSSSGHRCTTDTLYFLFTRRLRLLCTTLQSKLSKLSLHNPFFNRICHESGDCSVVKKKTKKKKIVVQNSTPICPKQLNPTAECLVTTKIKTRLFFSEKCEVASTEPVCGVQKCAFGSSIAFVIYDARTALREIEFERLPPLSHSPWLLAVPPRTTRRISSPHSEMRSRIPLAQPCPMNAWPRCCFRT